MLVFTTQQIRMMSKQERQAEVIGRFFADAMIFNGDSEKKTYNFYRAFEIRPELVRFFSLSDIWAREIESAVDRVIIRRLQEHFSPVTALTPQEEKS